MSEAAPGAPLVVRGIGELCTCDPRRGDDPGVIRNAAVAVTGGLVAWVGADSDLPGELSRAAVETVDASGGTLVPGFVDAHTHLVFGGGRAAEFAARAAGASYEELAAGGGGILSTVAATAAAADAELLAGATQRARRAMASGTTTIEVKTGYGLSPAAELRILGLIEQLAAAVDIGVVPTLLALHAAPPGTDRAGYVEAVVSDLVPAAAGRAAFCDVFCDAAAFGVDDCRLVLEAAVAAGIGVKLHAEQLSAGGGAKLAADLGATSADHLERLGAADAGALAAAGVVGVLLPGATLSLRAAAADARMMLGAGMTLALATDCNPGTSNTTDMRLVIALGVGLCGLTPAEALVAATRGGAAALRLADRGRLSPGMRFDAALLAADTHVDLAYRVGDVPVTAAWVGGRRVASA